MFTCMILSSLTLQITQGSFGFQEKSTKKQNIKNMMIMNKPFIGFYSTKSHRVIILATVPQLDIFNRLSVLHIIFFSFFPHAFPPPSLPLKKFKKKLYFFFLQTAFWKIASLFWPEILAVCPPWMKRSSGGPSSASSAVCSSPAKTKRTLETSGADPWHFSADPDPHL